MKDKDKSLEELLDYIFGGAKMRFGLVMSPEETTAMEALIKTREAMRKDHRWSGWPGAWCLDCGAEDKREIGIAEGFGFDEDGEVIPMPPEYQNAPCPEPGSNRHNPYVKHDED